MHYIIYDIQYIIGNIVPGKDLSGKDPAMSLRTLVPRMKKGNSKLLACMLMPTIARNVLLETVDDMCLTGLTVYVFLGSWGHCFRLPLFLYDNWDKEYIPVRLRTKWKPIEVKKLA